MGKEESKKKVVESPSPSSAEMKKINDSKALVVAEGKYSNVICVLDVFYWLWKMIL